MDSAPSVAAKSSQSIYIMTLIPSTLIAANRVRKLAAESWQNRRVAAGNCQKGQTIGMAIRAVKATAIARGNPIRK